MSVLPGERGQPAQAKVLLTRVERFSSAHRLHSVRLSTEENALLYGKCNGVNGHGHNYKVAVTVSGAIDSLSGMVMNVSDLALLVREAAIDPLDHKHIDKDVSHFRDSGLPSTAENIAAFIYERMRTSLPSHVTLESVRLHETDKNVVEIRRQD